MRADEEVAVGQKRNSSLFQPDILLPVQYLAESRLAGPLESEKRLMLAILEEAILCFQKYFSATDIRGKILFHDAERWLMDQTSDWLFSFNNICQLLGFNPSYLRKGLLRWKENLCASGSQNCGQRLVVRMPKRCNGERNSPMVKKTAEAKRAIPSQATS